MNQLLKNFVVFVLIFLGVSAVFALFLQPVKPSGDFSLSQVVEQINQGKVKKIVVEGTSLKITLDNDQSVLAQKEPDAALSRVRDNLRQSH